LKLNALSDLRGAVQQSAHGRSSNKEQIDAL
jgi:hypothetical protein